MVERTGEAFELGEQLTVIGGKLQPGMTAPAFVLDSFDATATEYTIWTLTFNPLQTGNTSLDPVLPQQFPDINQ